VAGRPFTKPRDRAPHEAGIAVAILQVVGGEPGARRLESRHVELGGDVRPLGTGTHHARIRARAQREAQRVHEDGFPGAGLAGERGEAARELEVEGSDDHEITEGESAQHGLGPRRQVVRSFQRILSRSMAKYR
jgi:hypothetical protein